MRSADKHIEKHIKNNKLHVCSSSQMDEKILGDSFNAMEQAMQEKQTVDRPVIWRTIMQSKISKLAVAAIIIIAALIGINQFGGSIDGCSIVLADVIENMKTMPWVRCSATIGDSRMRATDYWTCFDPSINAWVVHGSGYIFYLNYSEEELYRYDPTNNTITISPATDEYNLSRPKSPFELISTRLDLALEDNAEISSEQTELDGINVEIIHMVTENQTTTLVCDIELNLIISTTTETVVSESDTKVISHTVFDYPEEGPGDIYALGAPEDATVIDNVPKGNLKDLIDDIQDRFDNGIGDHTGIILESDVEDEGVLKPFKISIMRQNGNLKRLDYYNAFDCSGRKDKIVSLYEDVDEWWPDFTIEEIEGLVKDEALERQILFDGERTHLRSNYSGKIDKRQIHTDLFKLSNSLSPSAAGTIWVNPFKVMMGWNFDKALELLDEDTEHEGLVGFRVIRTLPSGADGPSPGTDDYWFDPEKDYMLVEKVTKNEFGSFAYLRTIVEEAGKTSDGKWYPLIIREEYTEKSPDGETSNHKKIKHILIDVDNVPDQNLFDPKSLME